MERKIHIYTFHVFITLELEQGQVRNAMLQLGKTDLWGGDGLIVGGVRLKR